MGGMYKKIYERIFGKRLTNKENHKVKYTVTGYGTAHRTADNYLSDPKVQEFLQDNIDRKYP